MARVLMTSRYNDLNNWPGQLFEAYDTTINSSSATVFSFSYGPSHPFEDYVVQITGSGFTYNADDGSPSGGTISKVVVRDGGGNVVLTIDRLSGAVPTDLAQIVSDMFGWENNGDGAGPDGKMAWNHLLLGNDTIIGTNGDDGRVVVGNMDGNDLLDMKGGDDWIYCGSGKDTIKGGAGFDILTYSETAFSQGATAFRGLTVNMATQTVIDCWGDKDVFTGIEGIYGSRFNDSFIGAGAQDEFSGLRGRDTLNGGAGFDGAYYSDDYWNGGYRGVTIDLETSIAKGVVTGFAIDGFGQRDKLISIEEVDGTRYGDVITGSRFDNRIQGREGSDTMSGGAGGDEFFWRETGQIGDDDVITDFTRTGAMRDVLQFRTERFDNMSTTLTLVNGTDATTGGVGTFVFDGSNSTLYWDADGLGGADKVKVVTLTGVSTLGAANFDLF